MDTNTPPSLETTHERVLELEQQVEVLGRTLDGLRYDVDIRVPRMVKEMVSDAIASDSD